MFLATDEGGKVNATFVTLLASCEMHGLEPYAYLCNLLCLLPSWPIHACSSSRRQSGVPQGVLCLISALSFHELTTQVPHAIDVALERGTRKPCLDYAPTRHVWFSGRRSTTTVPANVAFHGCWREKS